MDAHFSPLNILIVEDNDDLCETIVDALTIQGHAAHGVSNAKLARRHVSDQHVDACVVDLNLPGEDGLSLSEWLRQTQRHIGIIMLTARGLSKERVAGYQHGADIYLTKPASMDELTSAIWALSRRLNTDAASSANAKSTWLLKATPPSVVSPQGASCKLTGFELKLLVTLAKSQPAAATRKELALVSGQSDFDFDLRRVEVAFSRLRKKLSDLNPGSPLIQAIRGEGYVFAGVLELDF